MKVYWISRHPMHREQQKILEEYYGEEVEVTQMFVTFSGLTGLADIIDELNGPVWCVASIPYMLTAALMGKSFGFFTQHPTTRYNEGYKVGNAYLCDGESCNQITKGGYDGNTDNDECVVGQSSVDARPR